MIAFTLNPLVTVQDVSISKLWWEIHRQVMAGNGKFLWLFCLTTNVIASFTSCVFYSIKRTFYLNLHTEQAFLFFVIICYTKPT